MERKVSSSPRLLHQEVRQRTLLPLSHRGELLQTGKEVIGEMVRLIGQAKYSIDMQFYSYEMDATGKKILDACIAAKQQNPNLRIQLLIDNSVEYLHNGKVVPMNADAQRMRDETRDTLLQARDAGYLDVFITNQFSLQHRVRNSLRLFSNVLHRDHKKLFLVDTDTKAHPDAVPQAIVGSANITAYHEHDWKDAAKLYQGGPIIDALAEDFADTIKHAKRWDRVYRVETPGDYIKKYGPVFLRRLFTHPIDVVQQVGTDIRGSVVRNAERKGRRIVVRPDTPGREDVVATDSMYPRVFPKTLEKLLPSPLAEKASRVFGAHEATDEGFRLIDGAKKGETVFVVTPYPGFFVLSRHLLKAAKRGVTVNLIVPNNNNHVLYNEEKIFHYHLPNNSRLNRLANFSIVKQLRKRALEHLINWQNSLISNGVHFYGYTGKKEGRNGMIHFKGMLLERNDGSTRSLIGSSNF